MNSRYVLLLALLPLAPLTAQADTREDVISGAVRCAEIKDNRAWLDCYYGAAQPMRAELGLQPAPATQVDRVPLPPGATVRRTPAPPRMDLLGRIFNGGAAKAQMVF